MRPNARRSPYAINTEVTNLYNLLHSKRKTPGWVSSSPRIPQAFEEGEYPRSEETGPWGIPRELSELPQPECRKEVRDERGGVYNQYGEHNRGKKRKSLCDSEGNSEGGETGGGAGSAGKKRKDSEGPLFNGGQNKGQLEGPEKTPDNGPISPEFFPMGSGMVSGPNLSPLWCDEHWEDPISESTTSEGSLSESLGSPEDVRP